MRGPVTRRKGGNSSVPARDVAAVKLEPRSDRRRRQTRARLLEAALMLMSERGMGGVTINEITEAADVGFGSFYNHFESKEAIYAALVGWVFEHFAVQMDKLSQKLVDPAEIVSMCARHTLVRARDEPLWGRFLVSQRLSERQAAEAAFAPRLLRDIQRGIDAKRFRVADTLLAYVSVGGTVLNAITVQLQLCSPETHRAAALREQGFDDSNFPERTASIVLQTLGIDRAEAESVANRPLPAIHWEDRDKDFARLQTPGSAKPLTTRAKKKPRSKSQS
jgi:AcrR family transcriptional regulator